MQIIKLIRLTNVFIAFISVVAAIYICGDVFINTGIILLAAFSAAITTAAGNIINDIFDLETDRINKPARPIASGKVSVRYALLIYIFSVIISLLLSSFISSVSFLIVLFAHVMLFFYSYKLKKFALIGNIIVALLTGLVFIYGGVIAGNTEYAVVPALFAFLVNFIRELLKDIEDITGDTAAGMATFPVKYGIVLTQKLILILTVILILFTFHPFIFSYYKIEFLIIVMAIVNPLFVYFLKSFFADHSQGNLVRLSNLLKLNMFFGLIAILAGK